MKRGQRVDVVAGRRMNGGRCGRAVGIGFTVLLTLGAGTGTVSAAPALAAPSATPAGGCPQVAAEFVPGTWETNANADPSVAVGLLGPIADELNRRFPGKIRVRFPAYPAQAFTGGLAYGTSAAAGKQALTDDIASLAGCANTRWLIFGYSQGGDIAGDVASQIGCNDSPIPADRVLGVGLIADPQQANTGGQVVGPKVSGQGIAGGRVQGFCKLTSRVAQQCDDSDMYCSTNATKNPLLSSIGRLVTQPPGATGSSALTGALTSGLSSSQLTQLPGDLSTITNLTAGNGSADMPRLAEAAARTGQTLQGLEDTAAWVRQNPAAQKQLAAGAPGSAQQSANSFLGTLSELDLDGAVNGAASIANTAQAIAAGGRPPAGVLAQPAQDLAAVTAPIAGSPADVLSQAGQVLSILKPSVVIDQITNVGTNGLALARNVPAIGDSLRRLGEVLTNPALLVPGPGQQLLIREAHRLSGDLNNLFRPFVVLAANADLKLASGLLRMIPDPSGASLIAALIVDLLSQVDVVGLAKEIGELQEALWHGIETNDWLGAAGRAAGAGLGVVSVGLRALGSGEKTPTSALEAPSATSSPGLPSLASQFVELAGSPGADNLADIAAEGLDAASFLTSGAHVSAYTEKPIDAAGHTALTWLTEWAAAKVQALT